MQHGIDDPPGGLDGVAMREQRAVAAHGIAEQPLVRGLVALRVVARDELDRLAAHFLAAALDQRARADHDLGAQAEAKIVARHGIARIEHGERRTFQGHAHLRRRDGQTFAGTDVERYARPAPAVDMQPQGRKGLHLGVLGDAFLVPIAAELAAHDLLGIERPHGAKQPQLLGLACLRVVVARRRIHGEQRDHLQQMILDHVAHRADLFVESAAALDTEALRHGDLHVRDVLAVPDGLEKAIREAEVEKILHRLLAEVMIDAKNGLLGEHAQERRVQRLRGRQVAAEGFLDDDARILGAARVGEPLDHTAEHARRNGEVVDGALGEPKLLAQLAISFRVGVIAIDEAQLRLELRERFGVELAGVLEARLGARLELLEREPRTAHADDGNIEPIAIHQGVERGKDLLEGEIARRTEEHEGVGCELAHGWARLSRRSCSSSSSSSSTSATPGTLIPRSRSRRSAMRARRTSVP